MRVRLNPEDGEKLNDLLAPYTRAWGGYELDLTTVVVEPNDIEDDAIKFRVTMYAKRRTL